MKRFKERLTETVISELLLEFDLEKTWAKHGEKIQKRLENEGIGENHKEFFAHKIEQGDPTTNKEYAQWISSRYANGDIKRHEDIDTRVRPALEIFHKNKVSKKLQAHGVNPDINTHKSLSSLEDAVEKLPKQTEREKTAEESEEMHKQAEHYDEKHWHIIVPKTKEAAVHYGKGTRWCTSAHNNNYFNQYTKQGPLHILIPKEPKYPGEKYQAHLESGQVTNEKDEEISHNPFKERPSPYIEKLVNKDLELSEKNKRKI